ncbi:MAG: ATPase [Bacteroidetes bacterium GWF2_42_66]|nr:MAG: ATPase [Bacteroidetes bacterium GWA2_42_15]OFY01777.1 MAG: ATPase [Bacteroidetes bacterium GWE2_42_39]OFY44930.1 MAG: ATPase [Bacteroidetes bacterium GWF2_42_66]HBL76060.1 ATPase [Prolixibacteraceae bacterium]HCR89686.1 ATPase [Prolixibacteraceae bacterium]
METPFVFGKLAIDQNFTNRDQERQQLIRNFNSLTSTILISPRRWGKSSLVQAAASEAMASNNELRFCFLDVFSVRTEEQFYQHLAVEVLKASSSKMEILLSNASKFLGRFLPKLSFSPDSQNTVSLSLDWKEVIKQPDDILNMAENLAIEKGCKFIICIDEFQNISGFENPLAFQKKLRSQWQKHQHVAYCLYGSKRHMLMDVFTKSSMPFYKFGDLMFLEKIKRNDWIPFICKRFEETQKHIDENNAALIADLVECHPYYVQQLAQQSWLRTSDRCSEAIIHEAHEGIVAQLSLLFQSKTDELTNPQLDFLKALINGIEQFSSKETLEEYKLGTSANVVKIKKTLENKEIIDILGSNISLLDPMYKSWLKNWCFKN